MLRDFPAAHAKCLIVYSYISFLAMAVEMFGCSFDWLAAIKAAADVGNTTQSPATQQQSIKSVTCLLLLIGNHFIQNHRTAENES